jgi:hypothetical protein
MPIVASQTQLLSCHTESATDLFHDVVAQAQDDPEKSVAACFVPSQVRPDISITHLKTWPMYKYQSIYIEMHAGALWK